MGIGRVSWALAILAGTVSGFGSASLAQESPPPAPPTAPPPAAEPAKSTPEFKTPDELLDALENADKAIRTLRAKVQYAKVFADIEGGDKQIWQGELFFDVVPAPEGAKGGGGEPKRRFAVIFDKLIVGDIKRDETKHLIFDGEWFVERNQSAKQFSKRRVVKPGERIDPLKLGEGPFPLPIGQKKADILNRFKVELLPFKDGLQDENERVRDLYADTVQLRLTPRGKAREARDFAEVRIWYRKGDLLPRLARTVSAEGSKTEVLLIQQVTNQPIEPHIFNTDPPPPEDGWNINIQEDFRGGGDEMPLAPPPQDPKQDKPAPQEKQPEKSQQPEKTQ